MNQQPPDSPVNLEQLNQISEGDIEFEIEVLHVYVEDVSQRIEKIHDAITRDDWSKIMGEAHHLKGSSANVGALRIQTLAGQLEKLDQAHDQEKALEIINDMFGEIQAVELFIHEKSATLSVQKKI
ncbi:Hpt domain-containing protein [Pseudanabaena galeata UHCC 0370]|uniref:Hpt domain-containing protein n=1 Tax=Pseudanabaena galeata UHCC 0370 TaxID=3110310 RepID=A0ABU5TE95_9CYAN|nr:MULTISPECIES: Hpt domain-containing protein [Pseudanabaena]MEA5476535.1 Hpt domain-containing protein [Pseudanabaena galeata UHCC 0370]MEA5488498.1 Hpt domain-containing protein [Pseudanabaena sp. CCNP1317]WGS71899.1 Hpt domain-containing protein [Pseudanabaena galeata CCNP1313]